MEVSEQFHPPSDSFPPGISVSTAADTPERLQQTQGAGTEAHPITPEPGTADKTGVDAAAGVAAEAAVVSCGEGLGSTHSGGVATTIVPASSTATATATAEDWDDDEFGDFDAAPAVAPASTTSSTAAPAAGLSSIPAATTQVTPPPTASGPEPSAPAPAAAATNAAAAAGDDNDDDFGDFGDASSFSAASAGPPAAAATAAPVAVAQPPAAAAPLQPSAAPAEAPDILQLSGQDFLAAVLDAWQVFGAPGAYAAAAAQQPTAEQLQHLQAVQLPLPLQDPHLQQQQQQQQQGSRILKQCGLPLNAHHSSSSQQEQQVADAAASSLQWHGSASEARLIAGMGLTQAVQRALAAANKDPATSAAGTQQ